MDTPGLCTEMPDFSCICKIGRTNASELALGVLGITRVSSGSASFTFPRRALIQEGETCFRFFPLSEGVLHPGAGCSGAEGNIQCFWRKLLDFAQNN